MSAGEPDIIGPSLGSVFRAYREAMERYGCLARAGDDAAADRAFVVAQSLALGFWAGIEYSRRGAPE